MFPSHQHFHYRFRWGLKPRAVDGNCIAVAADEPLAGGASVEGILMGSSGNSGQKTKDSETVRQGNKVLTQWAA